MDFDDIDRLVVSGEQELFRGVSDRELHSAMPFNPNESARKGIYKTNEDHTDTMLGAISGSAVRRDEAFARTMDELRHRLTSVIAESVYTHPMYDFVQAVNGAMGIVSSDPLLGFETRMAERDIDTMIAKFRRIHALEHQKKDAQYDDQQLDAKIAIAKRLANEARNDREMWYSQKTSQVSMSLRFWDTVKEDINDAIDWTTGMRLLFDNNGDGISKLLTDPVKAINNENSVRELFSLEADNDLRLVLWKTIEHEVVPLLVQRQSFDKLYAAPDVQKSSVSKHHYFNDLITWVNKAGIFVSVFKEEDAMDAEQTNMAAAADDDDTISLSNVKPEVTNTKQKLSNREDINYSELVQSVSQLVNAWSDNNTNEVLETSFFSNYSRRAAYLLLYLPATIALRVLDRLLHDSEGPITGKVVPELGIILTRFTEVRQILQSQSKVPNAATIVETIQSISDRITNDSLLESLVVDGQSNRTLKLIRRIILNEGSSSGVHSETTDGFWTFIDTNREEVDKLMTHWKSKIAALDVDDRSDAFHENAAVVITATLIYKRYFVDRLTILDNQRNKSQRELKLLESRRRRDVSTESSDALSVVESEVDREKASIIAIQERIVRGENIGPTNDIVQATNYAFNLLKKSFAQFRPLAYSENIALTPNEDVRTLFAQFVASIRRKNQIMGPTAGYVQNIHYTRTKIDMSSEASLLASYRPIRKLGGERDGYDFEQQYF